MIGFFAVRSERAADQAHLCYLAKALAEQCDALYACLSERASPVLLESLRGICTSVSVQKSTVDVNQWRYLLELVGRETVQASDGLLLGNDSVFGPVIPLKEIFSRPETQQVDFWGLTVHGERLLRDGTQHPRYLERCFLVFRQELLQSPVFWDFFQALPHCANEKDAAACYDFQLTRRFAQAGFSWTALMDTTEAENPDRRYATSFPLCDLYHLMTTKGYPFVPKRIFTLEPDLLQQYHDGLDLPRAMEWIETETDYDITMIYDSLLPRMNVLDLQQRLNLYYIPTEGKAYRKKIGVFAYLFYEDLFPGCLQKLANTPQNSDLYLASNTEEKCEKLRVACREWLPRRTVRVLLHTGKGRDLSALLVTFRPYLMQYPYLCFVHDKKSGHLPFSTVGSSFHDSLWENMLGDKGQVKGILDLMERKPYLGFLAPPMANHSYYFHVTADQWTCCLEETQRIARRIGVPIQVDPRKGPPALGSMFWCRTEALKPLFTHAFSFDDFPDEPMPVDGTFSHGMERIFPYVAQAQGFASGTVLSREQAANDCNRLQRNLAEILGELKQFESMQILTFYGTLRALRRYRQDDVSQKAHRAYRALRHHTKQILEKTGVLPK